MTYKELIEKHLANKSKYTKVSWINKMINILNQIEYPDDQDKALLVILNDIKLKLS
jgi:hypothetical protein